MRGEYFSAKEQGNPFLPGGLLEHSHTEITGSEHSQSQRTSVPHKLRPTVMGKELKQLRKDNESAQRLATKLEEDYQQLIQEEVELAQLIEHNNKLEQMLHTREYLLNQLDSEIRAKQKELDALNLNNTGDQTQVKKLLTDYTGLEKVYREKQHMVERKAVELNVRQSLVRDTKKQLTSVRANVHMSRLTEIVDRDPEEEHRHKRDEPERPDEGLGVEMDRIDPTLIEIQRLRREVVSQRLLNGQVFGRIKQLAPD